MAHIRADEITSILRQEIENYERAIDVTETGSVISLGDGIARIHGLEKVMAGELIELPHGVAGIAMNLEEDQVGAVLLGEFAEIKEGDEVRRTGRIMSVPVGEAMIGRVVNALGQPIDGKGPVQTTEFNPVERLAPGVVARQPVKEPMQTGIKAIDAMIPIGRGQRELIIGDRQTGKTAIALDAIINQKGGDMICIYMSPSTGRSVSTWWRRWSRSWKTMARWSTASWSRLRPLTPLPCSIWRPSPAAPWANTSATAASTCCASTTIFRSTPPRIVRSRCYCAVRPGAKHFRETYSISTAACWNVPRK